MSWLSQDLGTELFILYNGTRIRVSTEQALSKKQYVALFFGANWCNGCKTFLPLLLNAYNARINQNEIEVIFVSYCDNDTAFKFCMDNMPWPAIPYDNKRIRDNLRERYAVSELPRIIVLDTSSGWIIHDSAQKIIQSTSSFNSILPTINIQSSSSSIINNNDINMSDIFPSSTSFSNNNNNNNNKPSYNNNLYSSSSTIDHSVDSGVSITSPTNHTTNNIHNNNNTTMLSSGLAPLGCNGC